MFFIILILGELSFQVLSYLKLFDLSKSNNTPLIISAVIAAIGTIVAFGYLLVLNMPAVERIANRLRTSE